MARIPGRSEEVRIGLDTNIRVCGGAGQGVQTTGELLAHGLAASGLHVYATQSYMSRIRGGVNSYDVRIADRELFSGRETADLLVAFTGEALAACRGALAPGGLMLFEGEGAADAAGLPLRMGLAAKEAGGTPLMGNSVAAGAVLALLGYGPEPLGGVLAAHFAKKDPAIAEQNVACVRKGAELVAGRRGSVPAPAPGEPRGAVLSGTEAIALGAAAAGVKVVASYPMTPSTGVFTWLAGAADRYGLVVEQAEDEIAAINLVCGAAYAGVPAMTTTSGGGFALMVEGLSLAGMLELPAVILLGQRPAPATGLPTRTAQEDLAFAVHAGHGEFVRAVFAPGSIRQAFDLTRRAFEAAHKYQTPAIILADQYLADAQKNVAPLPEGPAPIDRGILAEAPADYRRYEVTRSGVSPRAIPGAGPFVIVDSDEHAEDGHITEDLAARVRQAEKRLRKCHGLLDDFLMPEVYPQPAGEVLLCWGSTYGPCREATDLLRAEGRDVCMVHFGQVWPINATLAKALLADRKVTAVEGNARAQLAALLKGAGALGRHRSILRYDGLPFTGGEIAGKVRK
jgi:2-oxoglutarate ferredoxin oxidoreductase subunit alpha